MRALLALWAGLFLTLAGCGGSNTAEVQAPVPPGPSAVSGSFIYRYDANYREISSHSISEDGSLKQVGTLPVRADVMEMVIDPKHRRVYALLQNYPYEEGHPEPVLILGVQPDGSLRHESSTRLGPWPADLAIDPAGRFAYGSSPQSVGLDGDGNPISFNGLVIETFAIGADGTFTPSSRSAPISELEAGYVGGSHLRLNAGGTALLAAAQNPGQVISYAVASDGRLTERHRLPLSGTDPFGTFIVGLPLGAALHPNGLHFYVADLSNGFSTYRSFNMLRAFSIDAAGRLTEETDWENNKINFYAHDLQITPDGKGLYDVGGSQLDAFAIETDGRLRLLSRMVPGNGPTALVLDPEGRFCYVTNAVDGSLSTYTVQADSTLAASKPASYTGRVSTTLRAVRF